MNDRTNLLKVEKYAYLGDPIREQRFLDEWQVKEKLDISPQVIGNGNVISVNNDGGLVFNGVAQSLETETQNAAVAALAYLSSAQTISSGSLQKVLIDKSDIDTNSIFNATNNRLVIPVSGFYQINCQCYYNLTGATNRFITAVRKNSAGYVMQSEDYQTSYPAIPLSKILELNANEYLELYTLQLSGGNLDLYGGSLYTYISIHLIK